MRRLFFSTLIFASLFSCLSMVRAEGKGFELRLLNHWDNPDGTVERGYAGHSIFWKKDGVADLDVVREYGRMNQAIGINGTVLNNVNAKPAMLTREKLEETKRIADALRPFGITVYLSVNFASPKALGELDTADPLDPKVRKWWKDKAKEIYSLIPDFGGFLVKANSEGEPGPMDYGRTHVDGANMLAEALTEASNTQHPTPITQHPTSNTHHPTSNTHHPTSNTQHPTPITHHPTPTTHHPIVMWRAFVYSAKGGDRASQAYEEFMPYDGQFADNVIIQVKIGPVDFQPREPLSPLLFGLKKTKMMVEVQLTQEYTGECIHTCFMPNYMLPSSLNNIVGIAGVANIGDGDIKELPSLEGKGPSCGSIMAQANWYAFGRYASDTSLTKEQIAREWLSKNFTTDTAFVNPMTKVLVESHDAVVSYMMPLGLHHIFAGGHHYGPEPWYDPKGCREDWKPRYYHKAASDGIGFDRTVATGTGNTRLYPDSLFNIYENMETCPDELLLWFHHVPWNYRMKSGETLWDALCHQYDKGVGEAQHFSEVWKNLMGRFSFEDNGLSELCKRQTRFFERQAKDAWWWRDACLLYFQQFSGLPLPKDSPVPRHNLDELMKFHLDMDNYSTADISKLP